MTAIEIATGIIDKLQEENRVCLETLHKAQDTIKYSERQLAEKDRLIKVLEERLRTGTDGILEMSNRQKALTIRHLELQIQKLIQENEYLEVRLEAIKAEICPRCETKILMVEKSENRGVSKSYKPPGKSSGGLFDKKSAQSACSNRAKALERIIEHKDKRIMHLSKEVQRLTKIEKDLTQKVYRLTKLLPMSRLPPEAVTDCLLQEIQSLESQKQGYSNSCEKFMLDALNKLKKDNPSTSQASVSKVNFSKSTDRFKKSTRTKMSTFNLPEPDQADASDIHKVENEVLFKKLQKLCNDVNELKRLFSFESEKLSYGINSTANEYSVFKVHLEEIINNLNEVVQNILGDNFNVRQQDVQHHAGDSPSKSDDKYVISCLQERLKESLGMVTEYENENKALKEDLGKLKSQLKQQHSYSDDNGKSEEKFLKSFSESKEVSNINDVKKLKEIIKIKEIKLENAERHINSCQRFIEDLQNSVKCSTFGSSKTQFCLSNVNEPTASNYEQQNKILQTKLDVAEKNIKTCETVIEQLQNKILCLEGENEKAQSELHLMKSKAMSEESGDNFSRLSSPHASTLKKLNQELQDKVKDLEETNSKLEVNRKTLEKQISSEALEAVEKEKTLLQTKLEASEKHICSLEKSVEMLQDELKTVENERSKLQVELKTVVDEKSKLEEEVKILTVKSNLVEKYDNDVMALKNELILKEDENRELKESLHTLESKTLEMDHYRKTLHKEIENLCKALMENEESEDAARRKAIYRAAVLRSAQALLRLDEDYNFKPDDSGRNSALEEMKHQIAVYLTEVSRIHELVTIKEQERDELLRDYFDLEDDSILRPSPPQHYESHIQGRPTTDDLQSCPNIKCKKLLDLPTHEKGAKAKMTSDKDAKFECSMTVAELKILQEELAATKSVTTYLLSSCTRLEDLLSKERTERAKCERELEVCQDTVKELKAQLNLKNNMAKRLNSLIEMMRSKECNDDITLEQLKSDIKWLVDENQKVFEKVTTTQVELCQCKEENCRIQNDLDSVKRQLLNEKYENAKVNNELKHLRLQISNSQSTLQEL